MTERQPDPPADDEQVGDPASSHGSDLDARVGTDEDDADQTMGPDEAGP